MLKLLLATDGSDASNNAVAKLLDCLPWYQPPVEIHLLNVQQTLHGDIWGFLGQEKVREHHREEGVKALQWARTQLDAAGIPHVFHIGVGNPADIIVQYAKERSCDQIVIGPRGLGSVGGLLLGSVATKVLSLSHVPVLVLR
jgi:nucleotide-binding universal stress UspA family protein